MRSIEFDHLSDLALGASFLATGGGGDPHINLLLAEQAIIKYGPVQLIDPDELPEEANVIALGGIGSPVAGLELLPTISDGPDVLAAFEQHFQHKIDALVAVEVGGGNSLMPLIAGAAGGIPVVDGDGMGRAFPETQMMTYSIGGACPTPAAAIDYAGNIEYFLQKDALSYEAATREFALSNGGTIVAIEHPMSGAFLKKTIVPRTISLTADIGQILRKQRGPIEAVSTSLSERISRTSFGGFVHLCSGKIIDKTIKTVGGYDVGDIVIEAFDNPNKQISVSVKNEYLIVIQDSIPIATTPDLIVFLDYETSQPINAERVRYGQRINVIVIGAPSHYRTEFALGAVGPRAFGFDFDFKPIEQSLVST